MVKPTFVHTCNKQALCNQKFPQNKNKNTELNHNYIVRLERGVTDNKQLLDEVFVISAKADNPYLDLNYSGHTKNDLISIVLLLYTLNEKKMEVVFLLLH